jgi:hypothetical protein
MYLSPLFRNGAKMKELESAYDNNAAIRQLYDILSNAGIVDSLKEFNEDWLNRGEGYLRYLKHHQKQASITSLAICSSKLKHYSRLMRKRNKPNITKLADAFDANANRFDTMIMTQRKMKWVDKMEQIENRTLH